MSKLGTVCTFQIIKVDLSHNVAKNVPFGEN